MARITGGDGSAIGQADVASIARKVFDVRSATPETAVNSAAPVVVDSIFDTLQTDSRWSVDETGFNFADTVPASVFATGDRTYRVEYVFTPTSGQPWAVVFEPYVKKLYSS